MNISFHAFILKVELITTIRFVSSIHITEKQTFVLTTKTNGEAVTRWILIHKKQKTDLKFIKSRRPKLPLRPPETM